MTRGMLSPKQREVLLRPVNPKRVLQAQGMSHLPAFDVYAHLNRLFGFEGWDKEIKRLWLISEVSGEKGGRTGYTVTYGCEVRLLVYDAAGHCATFKDGAACGTANNLPLLGDAHDFAMKNAVSYAVKVAAKDLGDQFGLSLYNKGDTGALVRAVVPYDHADAEPPETRGDDEAAS